MAVKKVTQTYNVTGKFELQVGVEVVASSMEEALEAAKKFKVSDFIDFNGNDHQDSTNPEIISVWKA